jgi:hypothetical protein
MSYDTNEGDDAMALIGGGILVAVGLVMLWVAIVLL